MTVLSLGIVRLLQVQRAQTMIMAALPSPLFLLEYLLRFSR